MPVPGTTIPEPSPLVVVTAHAQPSASSTETCVVEPSRELMKESRKPGRAQMVEELRRALGLRGLHRRHDRGRARRGPAALQQRQRVGDQQPARARRRVGEHLAAVVADAHRLARDRRVGREVRARQRPAALAHPVRHRAADVAGVERRGAVARRAARSRRRGPDRARRRPRAARDRRRSSGRATPRSPSRSAPSRSHSSACVRLTSTPSRASAIAGAASSPSGIAAEARRGLRDPRRARRRRRTTTAPMWKTWTASPKSITDRVQRRATRRAPGARDHEVQQHRLPAGRRDEHVAARTEPGQQRLGHERRHQRRQRGVDRVAAGAQDVRAGSERSEGDRPRRRRAQSPPTSSHSETRHELGHVDVGRRAAGARALALTRPRHPRLADRLAQRGALGARRARSS